MQVTGMDGCVEVTLKLWGLGTPEPPCLGVRGDMVRPPGTVSPLGSLGRSAAGWSWLSLQLHWSWKQGYLAGSAHLCA